jgi:hypothetical protein
MRIKTAEFQTLDEKGRTFKVVEHAELVMRSRTKYDADMIDDRQVYCLADGTEVIRISITEFQVTETGLILRRVN